MCASPWSCRAVPWSVCSAVATTRRCREEEQWLVEMRESCPKTIFIQCHLMYSYEGTWLLRRVANVHDHGHIFRTAWPVFLVILCQNDRSFYLEAVPFLWPVKFFEPHDRWWPVTLETLLLRASLKFDLLFGFETIFTPSLLPSVCILNSDC